jgi:hypothetical protein
MAGQFAFTVSRLIRLAGQSLGDWYNWRGMTFNFGSGGNGSFFRHAPLGDLVGDISSFPLQKSIAKNDTA